MRIPAGWEYRPLNEISDVVRGGSPRPAGDPKYFNGDFLPWVTVGEITKDQEMYLYGTKTFLTELGAGFTRISQPGTLMLTNSGATLGVPKISKILCGANDGVAMLLNLKNSSSEYLYYTLLNSTDEFRRMASGVGQPNLNTDLIGSFPVLLPPLPEQRRIAAILSQWDESLSILAKLIEAKRQQKRGLAEQLLTGKRRLNGFEGEWERVKLADYSTRTKGKMVSNSKQGEGVPYIGAKSFSGKFEDFTSDPRALYCEADDVLILWDGEYAGNSTTGLQGAVSSTVARLRLDIRLNNIFLQGCLQRDIAFIRESRTGSGIPHMPSDFEKWYEIPLPPLPEQCAIASILSTLDEEITSLNALKAKVQEQKRGLMDLLLRGKVRVKVEEA